jgi:hypothetical protein
MAIQIQSFILEAVLLLVVAAQIHAECIHGKLSIKDESSTLRDVILREKNGRSTPFKLLGTIPCRGQTRSSMSWSPDGRTLATSTGQSVSVWRLLELHSNEHNMSSKVKAETIKVGHNMIEHNTSCDSQHRPERLPVWQLPELHSNEHNMSSNVKAETIKVGQNMIEHNTSRDSRPSNSRLPKAETTKVGQEIEDFDRSYIIDQSESTAMKETLFACTRNACGVVCLNRMLRRNVIDVHTRLGCSLDRAMTAPRVSSGRARRRERPKRVPSKRAGAPALARSDMGSAAA